MPNTTILGFDFGKKRIGVAVGDTVLKSAHPLKVLTNDSKLTVALQALLGEWKPAYIAVGIPVYPNRAPHPIAQQAQGFAKKLKKLSSAPISLVNEAYTSTEAARLLRENHRNPQAQKSLLDSLCAQLILDTWLSEPEAFETL